MENVKSTFEIKHKHHTYYFNMEICFCFDGTYCPQTNWEPENWPGLEVFNIKINGKEITEKTYPNIYYMLEYDNFDVLYEPLEEYLNNNIGD